MTVQNPRPGPPDLVDSLTSASSSAIFMTVQNPRPGPPDLVDSLTRSSCSAVFITVQKPRPGPPEWVDSLVGFELDWETILGCFVWKSFE